MSTELVPQILSLTIGERTFPIDKAEENFLHQGRRLFDGGFHSHALLDIWNAAVHNLRRRVEAYGTELFSQVVKDEAGRKKYQPDGETISERWEGVDDLVLLAGSSRLGLLSKKAAKALEMINWMRNHASAAHDSEGQEVQREDVIGLALILQTSLFQDPLPDPGHSVAGLFDPAKRTELDESSMAIFQGQIRSMRPQDLRTCYGFLLDLMCKGEEPGHSNSKGLLPTIWSLISDELKKIAGVKLHSYIVDKNADDSSDKGVTRPRS